MREEARGDGILLTELGYVKSGIDDIKRKQEAQDAKYLNRLGTAGSHGGGAAL